jgi:hypothetical protein
MLQTNYSQNHQNQCEKSEREEVFVDESKPDSNIQIELGNLEYLVEDGTRIPLTELVILDQGALLDCLDAIKEILPKELATAIEIVNRQQEIIAEAENYALRLVESAEERANSILQESAIVRQAELDGAKTRLKTEQECEQLIETTQNEIQQWRQNAIAECQEIQMGADSYADGVLSNIEQQLRDMLIVIQNGRQQLDRES